jgi:radical SAM superfamily enzyme YgiQ (UPF0313 family)
MLVNAPWHKVENGCGFLGIRAGSRWPHTWDYTGTIVNPYLPFPFYLATAAALAKKECFTVKVKDSIALGETYNDFYASITDFNPDVIVMEVSTPSLSNDLQVVSQIKNLSPRTKFVLCGIHGELEDKEFIEKHSNVDFIIYGEYEFPLVDLLKALRLNSSLKSVPNLLYRDTTGNIIKNGRANLGKLCDYPWPERDDLPKNYYDGMCGLEAPQLQVHTSRGCPYSCIFCAWPQMMYGGPKYRLRETEDVVNEILFNLKKYDYKSIYIDDDTFNVSKEHVLKLCNLFVQKGINKIPWSAMGRADLMDEEILQSLKRAGIYSLKYGVESFDQGVLDSIGKKMDLEKNIANIIRTKELGIKVHLTFALGLPTDTRETIEKTIKEAFKLPADYLQFSIATPYPGSEMYKQYKKNNWLLTEDWDQYNGSSKAVAKNGNLSAPELEELHQKAYNMNYERIRLQPFLNGTNLKRTLNDYFCEVSCETSKILVLQSATYVMTQALITELNVYGLSTFVLSHKRFADKFEELLPSENLLIFDETHNFEIEALRQRIQQIVENYEFTHIVVPCSNYDGSHYENVYEVAEFFGKPILKLGLGGSIIQEELN